ncbi:MAG: S-layer homology domain-containing protein [Clostridia bacterium]
MKKKLISTLLALSIVVGMLPTMTFAETSYISVSTEQSLRDAIENADGTTADPTIIQIANNIVISEAIYLDNSASDTAIIIHGATGEEVISCDNTNGITMFNFSSQENSYLTVTFDNITLDGNSNNRLVQGTYTTSYAGVSIIMEDGTTFRNAAGTTSDGTALGSGAAVYVNGGLDAKFIMNGGVIENCTNTSKYSAVATWYGYIEINDGIFRNNTGVYAGAISALGGELHLNGGEFYNNSSYGTNRRGGVAFINGGCSCYLDGSVIFYDNYDLVTSYGTPAKVDLYRNGATAMIYVDDALENDVYIENYYGKTTAPFVSTGGYEFSESDAEKVLIDNTSKIVVVSDDKSELQIVDAAYVVYNSNTSDPEECVIKVAEDTVDPADMSLAYNMFENGTSIFAGWYETANLSGDEVTTATSGSTYYAKWKDIDGIEITSEPTNTAYTVFDTFDTAGMEVKESYNDDSTGEVITEYTVSYENGNAFAMGDETVTITAMVDDEVYSTTVDITVAKADSLNFASIPVAQKYNNETAQTVNLVVAVPDDSGYMTYEAGESSSTDNNASVSVYSVTEDTLTYKISGGTVNEVVTIPVTISSTNYEDSTVNVVVTLTALDLQANLYIISTDTMDYNDTLDLQVSGGTTNGTVTYTVADTTGSATIDGSTLTADGAGTITVTATMAGNENYADVSVNQIIKIAKIDQTAITFTNSESVNFGETLALAVEGGSTDGDVTYTVTGGTGSATIVGSTLTATGAGTVTVTATKAGNDNYEDVSVEQTIAIAKIDQTAIVFTNDENNLNVGETLELAVTGGSTDGDVAYTVTDGTSSATIVGSTLTATGVGTVTVTATMYGGENYNDTTTTMTINIVDTIATATISGSVEYGNTGSVDLSTWAELDGADFTIDSITNEDYLSSYEIASDTLAFTFINDSTIVGEDVVVYITVSSTYYDDFTIEVTLTVEQIYVTVSFDSNDGVTVADKEVALGYALELLPTTTLDGYTFDGWYVYGDENQTIIDTTYTFATDTTLVAKWTSIVVNDEDDDVLDSDSNYTVESDTVIVEVEVTTNGTTASTTIETSSITDAITVATSNEYITTVLISVDIADDIETAEVKLPTSALSTIADSSDVEFLVIETNIGTLSIPSTTLATLVTNTGSETNITVTLDKVANENLSAEQQEVADAFELIYDFTIKTEDDNDVEFGANNETIQVSIPFANDDGKKVRVHYIAEDGTLTEIDSEYIDGNVVFDAPHFSVYAISIAEDIVVTFDAGSGTASYTTAYAIAGDTLATSYVIVDDTEVHPTTLPTATRSGYTFKGWYDADGYAVDFDTTVFEVDTIVTASWSKKSSNTGSTTTTTTVTEEETKTFSDVDADAYYADAIAWALENGITNGISDTEFGVGQAGAREQVMTFLWRLAGEPTSESENIFTDLDADGYYYDAIIWAIENGITNGMTETVFGVDATCTRAQIVTFLYRYAGEPTTDADSSFADVADDIYYASAVAWAVENGVTNGTADDTFSPDADCTREQIVTFLYRFATM